MVEIVLKGPGKNALGTPVMQQAIDDLRAADGQPVLLRGDGDAFSAGLNLKEVATLEGDQMERFLGLLDQLVVAILEHPAPVVAYVNGHAIAGGCVVALACDARFAADNTLARIGLNEVAIGLVFPPRVMKLARARLAPSHCQRVILEGGLYAPAEALRLGLVHEVSATAEASARAYLEKLGGYPREAFVEAKRELNKDVLALAPEEMTAYRERILPRWSSPEQRMTIAQALMKTVRS